MVLTVGSVYGDCYSAEAAAQLIQEAVGRMTTSLWVLGGDFNLDPAECRTALAGSSAIVVAPAAATCRPTCGLPSTIDYFIVSLAMERLLGRCRVAPCTAIATHEPVVLEVKLEDVPRLTRWIRPPRMEPFWATYGPRVRQELPEALKDILSQDDWLAPRIGLEAKQQDVDEAWRLWILCVL